MNYIYFTVQLYVFDAKFYNNYLYLLELMYYLKYRFSLNYEFI